MQLEGRCGLRGNLTVYVFEPTSAMAIGIYLKMDYLEFECGSNGGLKGVTSLILQSFRARLEKRNIAALLSHFLSLQVWKILLDNCVIIHAWSWASKEVGADRSESSPRFSTVDYGVVGVESMNHSLA
nr:hypothetical protein Iba_chr12dCG21690 [Ipomoea batatas]